MNAPPARRPDLPRFAREFPEDPELDALVDTFARGDFGSVRKDAPGVMARAASDDVRAAARELQSRTSPDPLARLFFALAAALLATLSTYWWWQAGAR